MFECTECYLRGTERCKRCQEDQEELAFEEFILWDFPYDDSQDDNRKDYLENYAE